MDAIDISNMDYDDHTTAEWAKFLEAYYTYDLVRVHSSVWWYFLEVLPPRWISGRAFIFAEGADEPVLFFKDGSGHYCKRFTRQRDAIDFAKLRNAA